MSRHRRGLRPLVYHLLSQGPRSGAELMDDIERVSRGFWRPSPGSIYPLLDEMAQEGVIKKGADGRFTLIGPSVHEHHGWGPRIGPRNVDEALVELRGLVAYLEDLKQTRSSEFQHGLPAVKDVADRLARVAE